VFRIHFSSHFFPRSLQYSILKRSRRRVSGNRQGPPRILPDKSSLLTTLRVDRLRKSITGKGLENALILVNQIPDQLVNRIVQKSNEPELKRLTKTRGLKMSDFQGTWKMTDIEAEDMLRSLRKRWSHRKYQANSCRHHRLMNDRIPGLTDLSEKELLQRL
jgi:hypothetical protein